MWKGRHEIVEGSGQNAHVLLQFSSPFRFPFFLPVYLVSISLVFLSFPFNFPALVFFIYFLYILYFLSSSLSTQSFSFLSFIFFPTFITSSFHFHFLFLPSFFSSSYSFFNPLFLSFPSYHVLSYLRIPFRFSFQCPSFPPLPFLPPLSFSFFAPHIFSARFFSFIFSLVPSSHFHCLAFTPPLSLLLFALVSSSLIRNFFGVFSPTASLFYLLPYDSFLLFVLIFFISFPVLYSFLLSHDFLLILLFFSPFQFFFLHLYSLLLFSTLYNFSLSSFTQFLSCFLPFLFLVLAFFPPISPFLPSHPVLLLRSFPALSIALFPLARLIPAFIVNRVG